MEYYIGAFKNKYAVFNGRSRRREFWMFMLFNFIAAIIIGILSLIPIIGKIIAVIYILAVICPGVGMGIRRLHDIGKSGWWLLIYIIPAVLYSLFLTLHVNVLTTIFGLILLVALIIMIVFWCKDSDPGDNKYGPNPKQS